MNEKCMLYFDFSRLQIHIVAKCDSRRQRCSLHCLQFYAERSTRSCGQSVFNDEGNSISLPMLSSITLEFERDGIPDAVTEFARDISKILYFVDRASCSDYW